MILVYGLALYIAAGAVIAAAFVTFGISRVAPFAATPGARMLFFPGAILLWPYVAVRWMRGPR